MAAERTASGIHHDKSALQPSDNGGENEAWAGGAQKGGRTDYLAPLLARGRKWEKIAVERAERDTLDPWHRELETAFDRPTNRCRRHSALLPNDVDVN